jgi:hypothetical protein
MNEFAALLYDKVNNLEEGLKYAHTMHTSHFQDAEIWKSQT